MRARTHLILPLGLLATFSCAEPPSEAPVGLHVGALLVSVGVLEGPDEQTFGRVVDLAVGRNGDLYVLDDQSFRLLHFSADGTFRGSVGREGDGPGEFKWPHRVEFDESGALVVLNQGQVSLARFDPETLALIDTRPLPFPVGDMCFIGSRLFVMSFHEGKVVHEIDQDGMVVASFGEALPFPVGVPLEEGGRLQQTLSSYSASGHLLCHEVSRSVTLLPHILPHLRSWTAEGELRWERTLDNYSQTQIMPFEGGYSMGLDPETGMTSSSVSLSSIDERWALIQTIDRVFPPDPLGDTIRSAALDLRTGDMTPVEGDLGRTFLYRDGRVYGWQEEPFPKVDVHEARLQN